MANGVEFSITGLDKLEQDMAVMIAKDFPQEFNAMLLDIAARLETEVKERTPVKTGRLQGDWKIVPPHKEAEYHVVGVKNTVDYAQPVEFGHRIKNRATGKVMGFVKGKHMLQNSLARIEELLPGYLQNWIDDMLQRYEM